MVTVRELGWRGKEIIEASEYVVLRSSLNKQKRGGPGPLAISVG